MYTMFSLSKVLFRSFFEHESACIGNEIPQSEQGKTDLLALSVDALRDGVSIVAREVKTNEIVGIAINKIQVQRLQTNM